MCVCVCVLSFCVYGQAPLSVNDATELRIGNKISVAFESKMLNLSLFYFILISFTCYGKARLLEQNMFSKRKLFELLTWLLSPERLLSPYLPSTCSACFHRSDYAVLCFRSSATTSAFAGFSTLYNDFSPAV